MIKTSHSINVRTKNKNRQNLDLKLIKKLKEIYCN